MLPFIRDGVIQKMRSGVGVCYKKWGEGQRV
jgi:hypothetical protein